MTRAIIFASLALASCTSAQLRTATVDGQLYCAKATAAGPLVVALLDAAGVPISVTGLASQAVAGACGAIDAIPVAPPPAQAVAPAVAAPGVVAGALARA